MAAHPINEMFSICHDQLLGKGSTGNVYAGFYNNRPEQRVAVKEIDLNTIDNEVTRYLLSCQIAALSNLGKLENTGHENIVKLVEVVMHQSIMYLVMELLQGGTLADRIKQHPQGLPEDQAMHIFQQVLAGYQQIKEKKIIHRDLKPDNILFRQEGGRGIAIIDFGYCTMEEVPNRPQVYYNVGSPKYMSPEAYKKNQYSQKSDIWAIGVMLYQMLMGYTCDKGLTMEAYLDILEHQGIPLPNKLSQLQQRLLAKMLQFNHHQRASCDHLLEQLRNRGGGNRREERKEERRQQNQDGRNTPVPPMSPPQARNNEIGNQNVINHQQNHPPPPSPRDHQPYHEPQMAQQQQHPVTGVQMKKQNSLVHLRSTLNQADLIAMRANNRNQAIFHSLVMPNQLPLVRLDRCSVDERQFRSESKVEPNQNYPREGNTRMLSFHYSDQKQRQSPHILERVQNVSLNSVRQIVHRRQPQPQPHQNYNQQQQLKQPSVPMIPHELRQRLFNAQSTSQFCNQKNMINNNHQPLQFPPRRIQTEIKSAHLIVNGTPQPSATGQKTTLNQNFTPKNDALHMSLYRPSPQPQHHQVVNQQQQPQTHQERPDFKKSPSKGPFFSTLPQEPGRMMPMTPQPNRILPMKPQSNRMIPEQSQHRNVPQPPPEPRPRIVNQDLTATRLPQQEQRMVQNERAINPQQRQPQESVHPQSPQLIHLRPEANRSTENRGNFPQMVFPVSRQEMRIMPQQIHHPMALVRQQ